MQSLLFLGIAVIILSAMIAFLPLGLSRQGKISIIIASLLISLLGLMALNVFLMWQAILIEVLVIGIVAYFMTKKAEVLLAAEKEEEERTPTMQQQLERSLDQLSDKYKHIALSDKAEKKSVSEELVEAMQMDEANSNLTLKKDEDDISVSTVEADLAEFENRQLTISLEDEEEMGAEKVDDLEEKGYLAEMEEYLIGDQDDQKQINDEYEYELEEIVFEPSESRGADAEHDDESKPDSNKDDFDHELPEIIFKDNEVKTPEKIY